MSHLPTHNFEHEFTHIPPVMKRGEHVLIVIQDKQQNYLLGSKKIYPQGIYRLVGGGVEAHQAPLQAAIDELLEELQLKVKASDLNKLAIIKADLYETSSQTEHHFTTHLYHLNLNTTSNIKPSDDLDDIKILTQDQLIDLIHLYQSLPKDLITVGKRSPTQPFRWSDYGQFYSQVHQIALDLTTTPT